MAGSSLFTNIARAAKVVVLLLFFVPWVTVSCAPDAMQRMQAAEQGLEARPQPALGGSAPAIVIARASGLDLAMGKLQMNDPTAGMGPQSASSAGPNREPPTVAPEVAVIAGAALLLIALLATFLKGAVGAMAAAGSSLLAVAAFCYSVFVHYPPAVIAAFAANQRGGSASVEQVGQVLSVQPDTLFYLVLLLLVLAVLLNVLAMRKPAAAPSAAP